MSEWLEKYLKEIVEIRVSNVDKKIYPDKLIVRLCNYMDAYTNDYITSQIPFLDGSADANEIQRFGLKLDDVIITKDSETPDDIAISSVVIEDLENVVCGYHLAILRPDKNEIDGRFLMLKLKQPDLKNYFSSVANGSTRYGLTIGNIENAKIKYPTIITQRQIANILFTIDGVLGKTRTTIIKYKALKQGMLQDLFTRGIDLTTGKLRPKYEDAPEIYKESKLGLVPGEWEVQPLDQICSMKSGEGITSKSIQEMGDYPVYGGNGLRGFAKNFTHEGEFTLIGRQGALCGNITRVSGRLFASEHAVVVTAGNEVDIDWVSQKLDTMNLNQYSEASAQPGLSVSKILQLQVAKPEYDEQKIIANRLMQIYKTLNAEQNFLHKLQKLKAGLMEDLLSGRRTVKINKT